MPLCIAATEGVKIAAGFSDRPTGLQIGLTAAVVILSGLLTGWASQPTGGHFKKTLRVSPFLQKRLIGALRFPALSD